MRPPSPSPPGSGPSGGVDRDLILTQHLRLGERMAFQTLVGVCVGVLIAVGAVLARYVVRVEDLDVFALVALGAAIVAYDGIAWRLSRRYRDPTASVEAGVRLRRIQYATILLDYVALTLAIWLVGGTRSPFLPFYLLHVILSCLLLSRRAALTLHWIAYGILVAFVAGEWSGLAPAPHMPAGAVPGDGPLDGRYAVTVLVVYGALFGLTAILLPGLARALRQGERQLRRANEDLERLSAMRRDFLRIALHNLQSPVGVVTMNLTNLRAGLGGEITEQQARWIERSLVRLRGVSAFMRDLQMLSTLESRRLDTRRDPVDLPQMLADLVADHQDQADQRGQTLRLDVPPGGLPRVDGIELLLREGVVNYVTNALKYAPEGSTVTVRARGTAGGVRIEVEDEGPGLTPEEAGRLFTEFVRLTGKDASTRDAAGRDPARGTGLGLTIVKRAAEIHGGAVGVDSEPGRGSRFWIELPTMA